MADKEILTDAQSLRELINFMPPHLAEEYLEYRSLTMDSAFPGRVLVVYTLQGGEPDQIDLVKFGEIEVRVQTPPSIRVTFKGRQQLITPIPTKLGDRDVFLSVPQNFVFRWGGQKVDGRLDFRPHYAILVKTRSKDDRKVDGDTYCTNLKRFKEMYPAYSEHVRF